MAGSQKISVIVPTFNSAEVIGPCLEALRRQTLGAECSEIIVVDNGSTDGTVMIANSYSGIRLVREATPGSYAARNSGIIAARYPFLAFTDADCIADPCWLEFGLAALLGLGGKGFVGGRITFTFRVPHKPGLYEQYDSLNYLNNESNIRDHSFAVTANLFTTRAAFDEIGLFNSALTSGGDREWGRRARRAGFDCAFEHQAKVYHRARNSLCSLTRKTRRVVSGIHVIDQGSGKPLRFLLSYLVPPTRRGLRLLRSKELGPLSRRLAMLCLMYYFKLVAFAELIRLYAGGNAERT